MTNSTTAASAADSLLNEIEELDVIEAEELQEGVAFHAFRFAAPALLSAMMVTVDAEAATLVGELNLPLGATLLDVEGDKINVVFDSKSVDASQLQELLSQSLSGKIVDIKHNEASRFKVTKL